MSIIRYISKVRYPKLRSSIMSSQNISQGVPNKKIKLSPNDDKSINGLDLHTPAAKLETEHIEAKDGAGNESNLQSMMRNIINSKKPIWKPLVWIDCEMTGLNVFEDHIIEICCIITDGNLNVIDEKGFESTIYYPKDVLDSMNEWCVNQHGKSGLTAKVLENPQCELSKIEEDLLKYIKQYVEPSKGIMSGNSIHMDKFFMMREFPKIIDYLHYRLVDVSSIMEVGYRHNPELMKLFPKKQGNHTAKSDILESINQLKWYKLNYLKGEVDTKDLIEEQKSLEKENNSSNAENSKKE